MMIEIIKIATDEVVATEAPGNAEELHMVLEEMHGSGTFTLRPIDPLEGRA